MPTMYCWRHCASRQGMARKLVSGEARRSARAVDDVPATKSDYLRCWFIAKPLASTGERFGTAFLCRRPEMQIIRRTEMLAPYAIRQLSEAIGSWIRFTGEDEAPSAYHGAVVETTASLRLDGFPAQSRDMTIQSNPLGRRPTHRSVGYSRRIEHTPAAPCLSQREARRSAAMAPFGRGAIRRQARASAERFLLVGAYWSLTPPGTPSRKGS